MGSVAEVMLLITPGVRVNADPGTLPEITQEPARLSSGQGARREGNRPRFRAVVALLLFALSAAGCDLHASISPHACRVLCAPRVVYSWAPAQCVCEESCADDAQPDGGR